MHISKWKKPMWKDCMVYDSKPSYCMTFGKGKAKE